MALFEVRGTVTAIGSGIVTGAGVLYDFIEITDDSGHQFNVKYAFVGGQAARGLGLDVRGDFLFDRVFFYGIAPWSVCKQLYAVRMDNGHAIYDTSSMRTAAIIHHLKVGLLLVIFAFGIAFLAVAALQIGKSLLTIGTRRARFLYGSRTKARETQSQEAVQM